MILVRATTPQDFSGCSGCSGEARFAIEVGPSLGFNAHVTRLCGSCMDELGRALDRLDAERDVLEPDHA